MNSENPFRDEEGVSGVDSSIMEQHPASVMCSSDDKGGSLKDRANSELRNVTTRRGMPFTPAT